MNKFVKVLVTLGIVFLFLVLFGALVGVSGEAGQKTPGILGVILMMAAVGAIRALWKKPRKRGAIRKTRETTALFYKNRGVSVKNDKF